jgi:hypothetical protein
LFANFQPAALLLKPKPMFEDMDMDIKKENELEGRAVNFIIMDLVIVVVSVASCMNIKYNLSFHCAKTMNKHLI